MAPPQSKSRAMAHLNEAETISDTNQTPSTQHRIMGALQCVGGAVALGAFLLFMPWRHIGTLLMGVGLEVSLLGVVLSVLFFGSLVCMSCKGVFTTKSKGGLGNDIASNMGVLGVFITLVLGFVGLITNFEMSGHVASFNLNSAEFRDIQNSISKHGQYTMLMSPNLCQLHADKQRSTAQSERRYNVTINGESKVIDLKKACAQTFFSTMELTPRSISQG